MMFIHHHLDNASSVLLCLLGDRRKLEERREGIVSSPPHSEAYSLRTPRLHRVQGEAKLADLVCNPLEASLLEQLACWSQRVPDFEPFGAKEMKVSLQDRFSSLSRRTSQVSPRAFEKTMLGAPFLFSTIIEEFLCLEL